MGNFAGVDWATDKPDVLVADEHAEQLLAATFSHDEPGLRALCAMLVRLEVQLVAIERPDGLLVERLLDAGLRVLALHPYQVALGNQLRAELERFWLGPIGLFTELDSPISLAFLARYPSPVKARALGVKRLQAFLSGQDYGGRQTPEELLAKLKRAPQGRVGETELAARRAVVLALVAAIGPLVAQIKTLDRQIGVAVCAHPDAEIFLSLFKHPDSVLTAAVLLAEIGDCRARYQTRDSLAADAGQAAVAIQSGKRTAARFRRGCNTRLRAAFSRLADSTRHWHPWAQDHYAAARARGHDHPRALRTLGRAWSRIIWRCWQDHTPYDPALSQSSATAHHHHDPGSTRRAG